MARTIPACLAMALLFAPCCWCSGEAQGLEDTPDEEEIAAEAEVGLLQVEVKLMPQLHAASSDALWSTPPVAISQALGSTSASPPSAPVLLACLAMAVVAGGLLSVVFLREIYLHGQPSMEAGTTSVRFMHTVVVSTTVLDAAKYACFIPLALDLASEVGWSPAASSVFIGGICTGRFMGSVLARLLQTRISHCLARQVAIAAVALTTVMEVLVCVPLLLQPTSPLQGYLIFGMRFLSGILGGFAAMANVIVRKCTPEKEHTPLSLAIGMAISVGMLIGPLMSTLVLTCLGRQRQSMEVPDKVAALILFGSIVTACAAVMTSFSVPTSIEEVSCSAEGDAGTEAVGGKNGEASNEATSKSSFQKEALILGAAIVSLVVCGLSCVSIEVATSMLLEVQFAWSAKQVGFATAAGLGPTGLLSLACILLTEFEVVRTRTLVGFLLMQAAAGVLLLYDIDVIHFGGLQLLCSDFLLYPSVSVLSCVITGEVFKIATKGSELISPESAQMVTSVASEGLDLLSVVTGRWLLTVAGRNGYATSQAVLVGLMFLAFHGASSEEGSEDSTLDAKKAVPEGSESAPWAIPDVTAPAPPTAAQLLEGVREMGLSF